MVGIFITARLGSTRLPEKHLLKAAGRTFIEWLANRYTAEFQQEIEEGNLKIFITTSVNPENHRFETLFKDSVVGIFYGSDTNIPLRHFQCAEEHNIDLILSIDGDDILCSTEAARIVLKKLRDNRCMVQTTGLPLGMNVTGYTKQFLGESLNKVYFERLETGWGKIFDRNKIDYIPLREIEGNSILRMTLDYEPDAIFFDRIISTIGEEVLKMNDRDLIEKIVENGWSSLNSDLDELYWANFNKQKEEEK